MKYSPDRRGLIGLLLIAFIVMVATPVLAQDTPPIRQADQLIEAGEFDQADSILRSVLQENPRDERALGYRVRIAQQQNDRETAYESYRELAKRSPSEFEHYKPVDVYYNTAKLAYQMEDYAVTVEYINRAQAQLDEGENSLRQQMEGWKLRANAAQERLRGRERQQQLRDLTSGIVRRLSEGDVEGAQQLLNQQEDVFAGSEALRPRREIVEYFERLDQWSKTVDELDATTGEDRLRSLTTTGETLYRGSLLSSAMEVLSDEDVVDQIRSLRDQRASVKVTPRLSRLYFLLGQTDFRKERYDRAADHFLRVRSLGTDDRKVGPSPGEVLLYLAKTNYQLGEYERARELLEELSGRDSPVEVPASLDWAIAFYVWGPSLLYVLVGFGLIFGGLLYAIPRFSPRLFTMLGQWLGEFFFHQDWPEVAFWVYALFCDPERMRPENLKKYLTVARQTGRTEERLELLERGFQENRLEADDIVEYGRLIRGRSPDKSQEVLERALKQWSNCSPGARERLVENLSRLYIDNDQYERGYRLLTKLVDQKQDDPDLLKRLSTLSARLNHWDEWMMYGRKWYRTVSDSFVQSSQRRVIGDTAEERRDADPEQIAGQLLKMYDKHRSVDLGEEETDRLEFLTKLLEESDHDRSEMIPVLGELRSREELGNKRSEYGRRLAEIYQEEDRPEQALEVLQSLRKRHPEDIQLLTQLGSIYVDRDRREDAFDVYSDIFSIQKDNVEAQNQLRRVGRRHEDEGDHERAERFYREILDHSSFQQPETRLRLGAVLYKQGKTEEALSMFQEIDRGESGFQAKILGHIGRCLVDLDMHDVAVDRMEEVDLSDGSIPRETRRTLYYWRGRAREGAGDLEGALEDYRQIMGSDVDFRDVSERVNRLRGSGGG